MTTITSNNTPQHTSDVPLWSNKQFDQFLTNMKNEFRRCVSNLYTPIHFELVDIRLEFYPNESLITHGLVFHLEYARHKRKPIQIPLVLYCRNDQLAQAVYPSELSVITFINKPSIMLNDGLHVTCDALTNETIVFHQKINNYVLNDEIETKKTREVAIQLKKEIIQLSDILIDILNSQNANDAFSAYALQLFKQKYEPVIQKDWSYPVTLENYKNGYIVINNLQIHTSFERLAKGQKRHQVENDLT